MREQPDPTGDDFLSRALEATEEAVGQALDQVFDSEAGLEEIKARLGRLPTAPPPSAPAPPVGRAAKEKAAADVPTEEGDRAASPTTTRATADDRPGHPSSLAAQKLSGRRRKEVVAVLLFSGGPLLESSLPLSVFGTDRQDAGIPRYRLLVAAGEGGTLRTTGGIELTAPYGLDALARAGTVVVPAWRSLTSSPPQDALDALRRAHEEGARIVGLSTGAFVLAAAGLLDGRPATTHWMYAPTLAKRYPLVQVETREAFVDDGDVLTSAGTAADIDLCLHLVRSDHGDEAAQALARRLGVAPRHSGSQKRHPYQSLPQEMDTDPLSEVITWALEHLHEQFDVETLAARAYLSRRTFDRRFRSRTGSAPLQWLTTQRVIQAQRLLETSDYSVEEVADRCGFRSAVSLRSHFRRQLGSSPAAYRAAYRARRPQDQERSATRETSADLAPQAQRTAAVSSPRGSAEGLLGLRSTVGG